MPSPPRSDSQEGEPARKRARPSREEIVADEEAPSSFRHPSKRVRVTDTPSSRRAHSYVTPEPSPGDERENEDDAPTRNVDGEPPAATPSKSQYEQLRDNNFEHLRNEDSDDEHATQRIRTRNNILGDNAVADNGIIESITCTYFMCHERLHVELGPLLHFIVGENGSGKSAILTAITLCLGGKASSTNRGGSLKHFIKEGRDRSVLCVKIKNQGGDAYRRDVYGGSIIVERHFSRTGASGFKVKSALNRLISTKKQEVDDIVEYYCLQVDNPLNVLSQDNARQFLNASSKAQKYKFFVMGVQLAQLDSDYRLCMEYLEANEEKVPEQEEHVRQAQADYDKARKLRESVENSHGMRKQRRIYSCQLIWAQVAEQEQALQKYDDAIRECDAKIEAAEQDILKHSKLLEEDDEKLQRRRAAVEAVEAEGAQLEERIAEAKQKYQDALQTIRQVHLDEREAHSSARAAKAAVADIEKKMAVEEQRLEQANGDLHARKKEELDQAKQKLNEIEMQLTEARNCLPGLEVSHREARAHVGRAARQREPKREEVTAAQQRLQGLERGQASKYDGYDRRIPDLLRMIHDDGGFREEPIGPVGAHIHLLKPAWSAILEQTLGGALNAFVVTSKADQHRLQAMMGHLNIHNAPIFIGNRHAIDTTGQEPDAGFDTILRVLRFDDDLVRNQLIIAMNIEQIILIADRHEAERAMVEGSPPANVQACLCFHDGRRGEGFRITNRNGSIGTTPIRPARNRAPRMMADVASQMAAAREVLQQVECDLSELESEMRRLQHAEKCAATEYQQLQRSINSLTHDRRRAEGALDGIQAELDQFEGVDGRLQSLREALDRAKEDKIHHSEQYGELAVRKQNLGKDVEVFKATVDEAKMQMKDHEIQLAKVQQAIQRLESARTCDLFAKNEAHAALQVCQEDRDKAKERRERQERRVQNITEQARGQAPERMDLNPGETVEAVQQKLDVLVRRLDERERRQGMSDEQVHEHFLAIRAQLKEAQRSLRSITSVNQQLKQTLQLRLAKWRTFQRYISANSRANFIYLLSERGFRGRLLIDHASKQLDIKVEPDRARKSASGRETKTLSGGEKSFASICLLLAIWEAMAAPLRCLDEFDVFMDNVNRAISTNMLMTAARRSVNRQYIFITPNAIEGQKNLDRDVKIIRLTDPRQQTLTSH